MESSVGGTTETNFPHHENFCRKFI